MKVNKATYLSSAVGPGHYPEPKYPEVAFAGRSNVGKSSLINRLVSRRNLVRTSSTPGRTQTLNFFVVNDSLVLVDLPGYGYAKAPKSVRAKWGPMVKTYLESRANLAGIVLIIDARHGPSEDDLDLLAWLQAREMGIILAATKVDKLKPSKRTAGLNQLLSALPPGAPRPIPFSATSGEGRDNLWAAISALIDV